ncbi:hypothetical protein [Micromonospora sp. CPCC 206061]|uniref:hypothetical protein n=1 Tax=Micromonospora sp. CPCC 206061 TaxID=3122410 RepID=UPI002FEEDF62
MGTMGNGNGGSPHDGGPSDGVPDLPPEWGTVIIPDDPSELAEDIAVVRRDLQRQVRREAWRRRLGRAPRSAGKAPETSLRVPLMIMSIAVLATLTSLLAMVWPGQQLQPAVEHTAATTPSPVVPALDLIDVDGSPVSLRGLLPAAVLLTDGCECAGLVADTATAARAGITVITVTGAAAPTPRASTPRAPQFGAAVVRTLADPTGELRGHLRLDTPGTAAIVLLVSSTGEIRRTVPATTSIEDFRADLALLV